MVPAENLKGVKRGAWECFTTAAALATATERVEIGTLVANTGYRNPALLARMADTIDELSDGRLILGLGAGDMASEHRAHGYPYERRVSRFEEALQIVRPMLRGESVSFEGEFYQTESAELLPKGVRAEGPPLLIGVLSGGPRMRRLVSQYADHWNAWMAYTDSRPEAYVEPADIMAAACEKHGRDPQTLEVSYPQIRPVAPRAVGKRYIGPQARVQERNITVSVAMPGESFPMPDAVPLTGTPDEIGENLGRFAELGVKHISLLPFPNTIRTLEALAPVLEQVNA